MKKSIFIIAALLAATFTNAQITYECTIDYALYLGSGVEIIGHNPYSSSTSYGGVSYDGLSIVGEYLWSFTGDDTHSTYNILDANTLSVVKSFNITEDTKEFGVLFARGIFTTDSKWAWIIMRSENNEIAIVTENGTTIAKLPWEYDSSSYSNNIVPVLLKTKTTYKLVVPRHLNPEQTYEISYDIYSLPGNGESSQDVIAPVAPRNSRKVLKKDQVLVENADRTYTLQGQEVK